MAKPKIYQIQGLDTSIGAAYDQANSAYSAANTGGGPKIASIIYPGNDTAANNIGGQTIYLTGSGFLSNSSIYINGNSVPSTSFISASNIAFTTPNLANGIYPIYLVNYDGATAIRVPGIVISGEPVWTTAAGSLSSSQAADGAWSYSLSANGDAPITYALAAGSSLPTGVSLNANGVISGTISSPPGVDTTYTFSVVASDAQNQDTTRQFSVTVTAGEGVMFANNVLLLHADGTNNGTNHSFIDSSPNAFTITRNGNATQGSFSPFSQTGWSNYFNGSTTYLTTSGAGSFAGGTGNWTIEAWLYLTSSSNTDYLVNGISSGTDVFYITFLGTTFYLGDGSLNNITASAAKITNKWFHLAVVKNSGTYTAYINGTSIGSSTTALSTSVLSSWQIGARTTQSTYLSGYISNLRVVNGTALYTSTFTPSTTPLTAVSGTSLLTCQSNRFIDTSTNNYAITLNGSPTVQPYSPFAPTAAYSTANVGGSMYLDGSGDYLTAANATALNLGTGDFTIEGWVYISSSIADNGGIVAKRNPGAFPTGNWRISYRTATAKISFADDTINERSTPVVPFNSWVHFAFVRSAGTISAYANGVRGDTAADSVDLTNTELLYVGWNAALYFTGYIADVRILKGTAQYSGATYTVPTAPLTAITNTSLLLNYTNAQIFDQTAKNVLECVGDAKVSTAQYKYGTGSIAFDGNGDVLSAIDNDLIRLAGGDFTIECWVYPTGNGALYDSGFVSYGAASTLAGWFFGMSGTNTGGTLNRLIWSVNYTASGGAPLYGVTGISLNTWTHVAVTKSGNTVRLFVNGTLDNSGTVTATPTTSSSYKLYIGAASYDPTGTQRSLTGYIDDLRITKGYARYTSNFTAPAAAFQNK